MGMGRLIVRVTVRWVLTIVLVGAMLFGPAGTWAFWPAWLYGGVLFAPSLFTTAYFVRHDPALIERRLKTHEEEPRQRLIILLSSVVVFAGFLLPGFDHRFGWSSVPVALILAANVVVGLGQVLLFRVMQTNSYASRVIEVEEGQSVVTDGPYAYVRHPMYAAVLAMTLATPLALGSYWALLPFALLPALFVLRILDEERVLRAELAGYVDYCDSVRHRLVPGIW